MPVNRLPSRRTPAPRRWSALLALSLLAAGAAFAQAPAPAPPTPVPFEDAVRKAASDLFSRAEASGDTVEFVVDPLIDAASGAESTATRAMERLILEQARTAHPRFVQRPFTPESLARQPLVLIGTFTAVNNAGQDGPRDAYRVCLALADLKSQRVLSKGVARAQPQGVDVTPTLYFTDMPVWVKDEATESYVRTCQGTRPGDPVDPGYAQRLSANALISEGIREYEAERFREALAFYRTAKTFPGGEQHRARLGAYLAASKLGRRDDAVDAFGDLVEEGLAASQLNVKLLFRPGSTQFIENPQVTEPYPMWLSQIATRARQKGACLEIVGHTSRSGIASVNERLSVLRAQYVMDLLTIGAPDNRSRMIATGRGFRDNLVGTGKDDASDAIDRRVEFKVIGC